MVVPPHEVPQQQQDVEAGNIQLTNGTQRSQGATLPPAHAGNIRDTNNLQPRLEHGSGSSSDKHTVPSRHAEIPKASNTADMENLEAVPRMQIVYQELTYTIEVRSL